MSVLGVALVAIIITIIVVLASGDDDTKSAAPEQPPANSTGSSPKPAPPTPGAPAGAERKAPSSQPSPEVLANFIALTYKLNRVQNLPNTKCMSLSDEEKKGPAENFPEGTDAEVEGNVTEQGFRLKLTTPDGASTIKQYQIKQEAGNWCVSGERTG